MRVPHWVTRWGPVLVLGLPVAYVAFPAIWRVLFTEYVYENGSKVSLAVSGSCVYQLGDPVLVTVRVSNVSSGELCLPIPTSTSAAAAARRGWSMRIHATSNRVVAANWLFCCMSRALSSSQNLQVLGSGESRTFALDLRGMNNRMAPLIVTTKISGESAFGDGGGEFAVVIDYGVGDEELPWLCPAPFYCGLARSSPFVFAISTSTALRVDNSAPARRAPDSH